VHFLESSKVTGTIGSPYIYINPPFGASFSDLSPFFSSDGFESEASLASSAYLAAAAILSPTSLPSFVPLATFGSYTYFSYLPVALIGP